jgi:heptosyltransferase-2
MTKILCICPIGIGNYLLVYPACRQLGAMLPEAELHLLALRGAIAELAQGDPLWRKIYMIDPTATGAIARAAGLIGELSRAHFSASLSFFPSNTWQYNLLPFCCGIKERFAFGYQLKKGNSLSFLNNRLLSVDPELHDVKQNLRLAAFFLGRELPGEPPVFPSLFAAQDRREAQRILHGFAGTSRFIGIHPGSSDDHGMAAKRWDPMRFAELSDRICATLGAQALIFGGNNEEKIKHIVGSVMKAPHEIIAPCNLSLTAALLNECSMVLANDSGLMHMAACMGVPTVAIFGPTDERRNGPVGGGHLVIRKMMDGFPLWTAATVGVRAVKGGVDPQASLKALTVNEAWEKVVPWLKTLAKDIADGSARSSQSLPSG